MTFDAIETSEINSNYIDKLTSLVSDMKMTMDRKQSPYKPRIYQTNNRGDQIMDKMPNRHLETEVKVEIELEITMTI